MGTLSSKQYVAPSTAQGTGQGGIAENMFTFDKRYSILYSKNSIDQQSRHYENHKATNLL
jgi:hypothetical protein